MIISPIVYVDQISRNLSQYFFFSLSQILGRPDSQGYGWRILFAFPILFVLFQVLILPWCPESPRFLYIKKRREDAAIQGSNKIIKFYNNIIMFLLKIAFLQRLWD